jgi:hypothetical protein
VKLSNSALENNSFRFVVGNVGTKVDNQMKVGSVEETVTSAVTRRESMPVKSHSAVARSEVPSENIIDLQRRVAGLLPIRVDRAGSRDRVLPSRDRLSSTKTRTCHFITVADKRLSYEKLGMNLML